MKWRLYINIWGDDRQNFWEPSTVFKVFVVGFIASWMSLEVLLSSCGFTARVKTIWYDHFPLLYLSFAGLPHHGLQKRAPSAPSKRHHLLVYSWCIKETCTIPNPNNAQNKQEITSISDIPQHTFYIIEVFDLLFQGPCTLEVHQEPKTRWTTHCNFVTIWQHEETSAHFGKPKRWEASPLLAGTVLKCCPSFFLLGKVLA